MSISTKWRCSCFYCNDTFIQTVESETPPLKCPNDHTYDGSSKLLLLETINPEPARDLENKLVSKTTPRPFGTKTYWTGIGDDPAKPMQIGGGERLSFYHMESDTDTDVQVKIIDLNCNCNSTYIYKGHVLSMNALHDYCTLEIIPRLPTFELGVDTDYWENTTYYGALIVPPNVYGGPGVGHGNVDITSDLGDPNGGLVYMPLNEFGELSSPAFWDAECDYVNQRFINITPKPYGDGHFNIFKTEMSFGTYANTVNLLGDHNILFESHDTDKIGHGMRIKITATTDKVTVSDHTWSMVINMMFFRKYIIGS